MKPQNRVRSNNTPQTINPQAVNEVLMPGEPWVLTAATRIIKLLEQDGVSLTDNNKNLIAATIQYGANIDNDGNEWPHVTAAKNVFTAMDELNKCIGEANALLKLQMAELTHIYEFNRSAPSSEIALGIMRLTEGTRERLSEASNKAWDTVRQSRVPGIELNNA